MSYLLRSYVEHIKFRDLHAADPLPLITSRDIMDTKVFLLLEALLRTSNTFYEVLLLQINLEYGSVVEHRTAEPAAGHRLPLGAASTYSKALR